MSRQNCCRARSVPARPGVGVLLGLKLVRPPLFWPGTFDAELTAATWSLPYGHGGSILTAVQLLAIGTVRYEDSDTELAEEDFGNLKIIALVI